MILPKTLARRASHWLSMGPGLVAIGLLLLARWLGVLEVLELKTLDVLLRLRSPEPQDQRILIVGIDEQDIQQMGTYPMPDATLAALLETLEQHNPRAIGLDIYRDLPVPPGTETLAQTFAAQPRTFGIEKVLDNPVRPSPLLPPERIGFVDLPLDRDGFVRRILLGVYGEDEVYRFALSLRLAEVYLAAEGLELGNGDRYPEAMRFGQTEFVPLEHRSGGYRFTDGGNEILLNPRAGSYPFRQVTLRQVMAGEVDSAWICDAIVLIGITTFSMKDLVNTAAIPSDYPGQIYGVEFHAHATSQIISTVLDNRPLIQVWPTGVEYAWIAGWGLVGIATASATRRLWLAVCGVGAVLGGLGVLGWGLMTQSWWIPLGVPAIAFVITSTLTTTLRLTQAQQQMQMSQRLLGQQTSPEIAQALWQERQRLTQEGRLPAQVITATILFSDIRGFTALSEQQSPQQVLGWLNEYLVAMTEEVQRYQGVVNKFIGDGLMAVFGVPIARTNPADIAMDARHAVACALAMEQRLADLNQRWQAEGMAPLQIRIGIFTGPVMVGSLGGAQRLEYGVIGDSVNTASRLESCAKQRQPTHCRILITQATLDYLSADIQVEPWGEVLLRGKQHPLQIYRVIKQTLAKHGDSAPPS